MRISIGITRGLAAVALLGLMVLAVLVVVAVSIVGYARLKRRYRLETLKAVVDTYAQREIRKETSRSPRWTNALRTLDGVYAGQFD